MTTTALTAMGVTLIMIDIALMTRIILTIVTK
jgi:hypothetical protein